MTKGQQAVSSLPHQDPGGIVTVTPNGSTSFVDPLITQTVIAQLQQPRTILSQMKDNPSFSRFLVFEPPAS